MRNDNDNASSVRYQGIEQMEFNTAVIIQSPVRTLLTSEEPIFLVDRQLSENTNGHSLWHNTRHPRIG